MNHLNTNDGFHGNQSCGKRLIFGQTFRKTLFEWILRRVTRFLLGGVHNVSPWLWSTKKPGWDRAKTIAVMKLLQPNVALIFSFLGHFGRLGWPLSTQPNSGNGRSASRKHGRFFYCAFKTWSFSPCSGYEEHRIHQLLKWLGYYTYWSAVPSWWHVNKHAELDQCGVCRQTWLLWKKLSTSTTCLLILMAGESKKSTRIKPSAKNTSLNLYFEHFCLNE